MPQYSPSLRVSSIRASGLLSRSATSRHPARISSSRLPVQPDGAGTGMLAAVDAGSPEVMATGMRVEPVWADEREGSITDITCWKPIEGSA